MKITGIILIIMGFLAVVREFELAAAGQPTKFEGLALIVLGAFLISRANKKKQEDDRKKQWEDESVGNK